MRQRFGFILGVTLCAAAGLAPQAALAQEPTAAGLWEKLGDAGKPEGWFRIAQCEGQFEGKIVKIFPKPGGEDPQQWRCTECEGKQKNAPVLGLTFIKGMRRNGLAYENGTILDPRDGSVYRASMRLSPDGKTLTVRGYLGIPLLGQNEVWRRLPDNTPAPPFSGACTAGSGILFTTELARRLDGTGGDGELLPPWARGNRIQPQQRPAALRYTRGSAPQPVAPPSQQGSNVGTLSIPG